jgi:Ca2+/H+ antiporter, TMEM165/GDT1 family
MRAFLVVLGVMFLMELPDKTMIALIVMGTRARPLMVFLGGACAFVAQMALAVGAGSLLTLMPRTAKDSIIATLFFLGAAYLLFVPEKGAEVKGADAGERERRASPWREALTAFTVIFVGEFGDLTQIQAANFAAKYNWRPVFLASALALVAIAALGAWGGQRLQQIVPLAVVRKVGGLVFLGYGAVTVFQMATA